MKKVALVTGASSGIGWALAHELVKKNYNVAVCARRLNRLENLKKELGDSLFIFQADITDPIQQKKFFEETIKKFSKLDLVIANAGFSVSGKVENLISEDYRRQFELNVFASIDTAKLSLEPLKKTQGTFALVGSALSYFSLPNSSAYCMSKHAVKAFTESLFYEWKAHGIHVSFIAPGFVESEIQQVDNQGRFREKIKNRVPKQLMMKADAAAKEIVCKLEKKKREIYITWHGRILSSLYRHLPSVFVGLLNYNIRKGKFR